MKNLALDFARNKKVDGTCPCEFVELSGNESGRLDLIEFDTICQTLLSKPSNLGNHELQH